MRNITLEELILLVEKEETLPGSSYYEILQACLNLLIQQTWPLKNRFFFKTNYASSELLVFPFSIQIPPYSARQIANKTICFEFLDIGIGHGEFGKVFTLKNALIIETSADQNNFNIIYRLGPRRKVLKHFFPNYTKQAQIKAENDFFLELSPFPQKSRFFSDLKTYDNTLSMYQFEGEPLSEITFNESYQDTVFFIFYSFLQSIHDIHDADIEHSDIKPENVLFDKTRFLFRWIDFGLSQKLIEKNNPLNHKGTPIFFAPEKYKLHINEARQARYYVDIEALTTKKSRVLLDVFAGGLTFTASLLNKQKNFPDNIEEDFKKIFNFPEHIYINMDMQYENMLLNPDHFMSFQTELLRQIEANQCTKGLESFLKKMMAYNASERFETAHIIEALSETHSKEIMTGLKIAIQNVLNEIDKSLQTIKKEILMQQEKSQHFIAMKVDTYQRNFEKRMIKLTTNQNLLINNQKNLQELLQILNEEISRTPKELQDFYKVFCKYSKPVHVSHISVLHPPIQELSLQQKEALTLN